jgi:hypothetical protein
MWIVEQRDPRRVMVYPGSPCTNNRRLSVTLACTRPTIRDCAFGTVR